MIIINENKNKNNTSVLLGIFDGLHIGHLSAVGKLNEQHGEKLVYTFDSASVTVKGERKLLISDEKKKKFLTDLGADRVISVSFESVKDISAEDFVKNILLEELNAGTVICGENFHFGRGGKADSDDLKRICRELGINAIAVPTVCDGLGAVSTTRIRLLIEKGDMREASRLLGRKYSVCGDLKNGEFIPEPDIAVPLSGKYRVTLNADGQAFKTAIEFKNLRAITDAVLKDGPAEIVFE